MKESSVSAPFMKKMRELLPGSIVVKHQDRSMIGLPDCSITWGRRPTCWLEFKLINCPVKPMDVRRWEQQAIDIGMKSPTQWQFMKKAGQQGIAYHVVWVRKTCVLILDHSFGMFQVCKNTGEAAEWIALLLKGGLTGWTKENPQPRPGVEEEDLVGDYY